MLHVACIQGESEHSSGPLGPHCEILCPGTPIARAQSSCDFAARVLGHCDNPCGSSPRKSLDLAFFPVLVGGRQ
eukprot:4458137-Pyramimonas_sp.AAC.1